MSRRNAHKRGGRSRPPAPSRRMPEVPLERPVAAALWGSLTLLALARALTSFEPSMWAWSLNLQRFLAPILGWGLWGLAALALVPALARRAAPLWNAGGDAFERHPALATWGAVVFAILLVGVWPDRVRF